MSNADAFLDHLTRSTKQTNQIMREYAALLAALIEAERQINPELTWSEGHEAARTRYQRHLT